MDRRSPFFLVLMIVLFGVAIAVAISIFGERNMQMRRDMVVSSLQHIAADALQFRRRPSTMGGGGGSYDHYSIPVKLRSNEFAAFAIAPASKPDTLIIVATAPHGAGSITASVDPGGTLVIRELAGDFSL